MGEQQGTKQWIQPSWSCQYDHDDPLSLLSPSQSLLCEPLKEKSLKETVFEREGEVNRYAVLLFTARPVQV